MTKGPTTADDEQDLAAPDTDRPNGSGILGPELRGRVLRIARALLRNGADAEDAAQVSMLEIAKSLPSFRGESPFQAWADRIAVRTAMRFARTRRLVTVGNDASIQPDDLTAAEVESRGEELPRPIRAYLDELPEARRTVLVLRHAMGYSVEEIAGLTGVSVNTVKDRLLQAREQIRKMVRRELALGPAPVRRGGKP